MKEKYYHHHQLGHDDERRKPLEQIWLRRAERGGRLGEPQLPMPSCFSSVSDECQAERQGRVKKVVENTRKNGRDDKNGIYVWPDKTTAFDH